MEDMNKKEKEQDYSDHNKIIKKESWVFFDEINTCFSLSLLMEIFINRTYIKII